MALSQRDKADLKAIIKGRFKTLKSEAHTRVNALLAERQRVEMQAHEADIESFTERLYAIHEEVNPLNKKIQALLKEAKKKGLDCSNSNYAYLGKADQYYAPKFIPTTLVKHDDRHYLIQDVYNRIDNAELKMIENLIIENLDSEDARAWLDGIPTVEELVADATKAQLEAGKNEE